MYADRHIGGEIWKHRNHRSFPATDAKTASSGIREWSWETRENVHTAETSFLNSLNSVESCYTTGSRGFCAICVFKREACLEMVGISPAEHRKSVESFVILSGKPEMVGFMVALSFFRAKTAFRSSLKSVESCCPTGSRCICAISLFRAEAYPECSYETDVFSSELPKSTESTSKVIDIRLHSSASSTDCEYPPLATKRHENDTTFVMTLKKGHFDRHGLKSGGLHTQNLNGETRRGNS
jgi:hypothetical protein